MPFCLYKHRIDRSHILIIFFLDIKKRLALRQCHDEGQEGSLKILQALEYYESLPNSTPACKALKSFKQYC